MKSKFITILFLFINIALFSQFPKPKEVSLIKNFNKKDFKSTAKIFNISQSKNGEIYFATPGSLLTFDGFTWSNYSEKNTTDLRDVLYVNDKEIYTSGHGGFGVWSKNTKGQLNYKSLFFKVPTKKAPLLPVFRNIIKIGNRVYFQSFQQIYVYNTLSKSIDIIYASKGFSEMFLSNKKIYVQDSDLGLFEIRSNQKVLVKGTQNNSNYIINVFESRNSLLLATRNNGFCEVAGDKLIKKDWKVNQLFEKNFITDIKKYDDNTFLVGTLRNGIYVMSVKGFILNQINKDKSIENNSIRKLYIDNNKNVWAATEAGLSYLEFNNNLKFIIDKTNDFGTAYTSLLNDSILYIGTNQGLYSKNLEKWNSKPKLLDDSIEQIWEIFQDENEILVGTHKGVFKLENNTLKTVHLEGGAWTFRVHPVYKDLLYVGFYSGLAIFRKVKGAWKFVKKFKNYGESSRFVEFDSYNQIWVAHPSKGYYRLKLSDDGLNLDEVDFYGKENAAVETYAYFTKIDGKLVFFNPKGYFLYNAIDNNFTEATYPYKIFEGLKNINHIQQYENLFWYSTDNTIGYVERNRGSFNTTQSSFYSIWDKNLKDFNRFKRLKNNIYGINIDNGFAFYDYKSNNKHSKTQKPIIQSIKAISAKDTINLSINFNELEIPFKNNYIKVSIALPNLPYGSARKVKHRLKGLQNVWSQAKESSEINYTGLSAGNYELEIQNVIDIDNKSESILLPFKIDNPWYFNNIAKIFYIFCFVLIFYVYTTYVKRRSRSYVIKLKQLEQVRRERQQERFEIQKLASDKQLLLLKEKNLNLEIKKKSSALASSTLNNIKKNELLTDIINDVKDIDKELLNSALHYPIKKVIKKINNHLKDKEDWLTFELHFRNSHAQFFENLRKAHPDLSPNEIKLSAYLKLNLSSKEIASLMNVAKTSVEQSRYRLRKRFNLNKEDSLINYIRNI